MELIALKLNPIGTFHHSLYDLKKKVLMTEIYKLYEQHISQCFPHLPRSENRLWGPPSLLSNGYLGLLPRR
jgi:hypothetical protein